MTTTPTVLLFDVDGTLLDTGRAGRNAIERAFDAAHGRPDATQHIRFSGMTDHRIIGLGLEAIGLPDHHDARDHVLSLYLTFLEEEVAASPRYRVMPAVHDLLADLANRPHLAIGLGTGNLERGARTKLARADLNRWFSFGGFGCDHVLRHELLAAGARRGADALGRPLHDCRVVIIGDTPLDVRAAHDIGATCLAVATGTFSAHELTDAGADHTADDLSQPWILDALLP
jgi:phosphoglycolate phosphatase